MKKLILFVSLAVLNTTVFASSSILSQSTLATLIVKSHLKSRNIAIVYGGKDISRTPSILKTIDGTLIA